MGEAKRKGGAGGGRTQVGRLAMRQEGADWVAYYALPGTMEGALRLGSVALRFVADRPERKELFMALMREAVGDILEDATGIRPSWGGPRPAPESERAGSA